jgi:hypothetical protein
MLLSSIYIYYRRFSEFVPQCAGLVRRSWDVTFCLSMKTEEILALSPFWAQISVVLSLLLSELLAGPLK